MLGNLYSAVDRELEINEVLSIWIHFTSSFSQIEFQIHLLFFFFEEKGKAQQQNPRGLALWKANKIGNWEWGNLWHGRTSPRWIWWDTKGTNDVTWTRNCLKRGVEYQCQRNYGEIRPSLRDFSHCTNCSKIANFCIDKVSKSTSLEVTTGRTDHTYIVIDYAWCICAFNFVVGFILRRLQL